MADVGILNLYKPPGISSNFFLTKIKKFLPKDYLKVGHFGTLDPMACGVLLIGYNGAARLNSFVLQMPKTYLAVGSCLGQTVTGDRTEEISDFSDQAKILEYFSSSIDKKDFIVKNLIGEYWQAPHLFSAAKFKGKSLYAWARSGRPIVKEKQKRNIYQLEILRERAPYILFKVTVSSGTYVRTLFEDYCREFGLLGHLVSLVRLSVGNFNISDSLKLDEIKSGNIFPINPSSIISLPQINLDENERVKFIHGAYLFNRFAISDYSDGQHLWVRDANGQCLGLGQIAFSGEYLALKPVLNWFRPIDQN